MQKYIDAILAKLNGYLVPAAGASVTVKTYPAGAVASIYSDNGVTTKTNPMVVDENGGIWFYAADGHYTLEISGGGYTGASIVDISLGGAGGGSVVGPTWSDLGSGKYQTTNHLKLSGKTYITGPLYENAVAMSGTAIDPKTGSVFSKTLSSPATLTISDVTADVTSSEVVSFTLEITNSGGARTITWPASVKWSGGTVPTPTAAIDVYTFYSRDAGTTWRGALVASYTS